MQRSGFLKYLQKLYIEKRELVILEITYAVISLISFIISAVIALLNQSLGVALLVVPFIAFLALSTNLIVWSLIKMIIEELVEKEKEISSDRKSSSGEAKSNKKKHN